MGPHRTDFKLHRTSTPESVAAILRAAIVNGDFPMGSSLNEKALCALLNVSRTPVREALIELQGQALVKIIPYRGAFVFDLDLQEFEELGIYRAMLEKAALDAAFKYGASDLCAELGVLVDKMKDSAERRNRKGYGKLDTQYHEAIIQYSGNRFLIHAYSLVGLRLATLRHRIQHDAKTVGTSLTTHEAIVEMLREGNREQALDRLDQHINLGMTFFSQGMERFRNAAAG